MLEVRKLSLSLYVDRTSQHWIVLDSDGNYWTVPAHDGWCGRQPFRPSDETELEPVPGHYKYVLGLPT